MRNPLMASLALLIATAGAGHALRCSPMDAAAMYLSAAESEHRYVIVNGAFLRNGPDRPLPVELEEGMGVPYVYDALFYGNIASRIGFHTPTELEVTIAVTCVASWCGTPPPDGLEVLAFLRVDEDRNYFLEVEACPSRLIFEPSEDALNQIADCMTGDACGPEDHP